MNLQSRGTRYRVQGGLLLLVCTGKAAELTENRTCCNVFVRKPALFLERLLFSLKHVVLQPLLFDSCSSCPSRSCAWSSHPRAARVPHLSPAPAPGS